MTIKPPDRAHSITTNMTDNRYPGNIILAAMRDHTNTLCLYYPVQFLTIELEPAMEIPAVATDMLDTLASKILAAMRGHINLLTYEPDPRHDN